MPLDVKRAVVLTVGLCQRFEGLRLSPYLDSQGVPTIGYGTTIYPNGVRVTIWDRKIDDTQAMHYLRSHIIRVAIPAVLTLVPTVPDSGKLAALADFVYNLGASRLAVSTLRRYANANRWVAANKEFGKWVHGGSTVLPGLVHRRAAEAALASMG